MEMLRSVIWDVEEWAELGWAGLFVWVGGRRQERGRNKGGGQQDLLQSYYSAKQR
jgi:hypothetical protein